MYKYIPPKVPFVMISKLKYGQYFMFTRGSSLNECTHIERNVMLYRNLITGKLRRVKGFIDTNKCEGTCKIRYVKIIDSVFDRYYNDKLINDDMPF